MVDQIGRVGAFAGVTAVVTGAAGFIGSHVTQALGDGGARVVAIDRAWAGRPSAPGPRPEDGRSVRRVGADLGGTAVEPLVSGADVVFHLAARPGVWPSWTSFDEYLQANVSATKRLLDACLAAGVPRVVLASSSSVYGDGPSGPITEERLPRPISPYAVTKLAAEQLALGYSARRDAALTVVVLRYFTVFGPRQRPDMLISRAIRAAVDGSPVRIHGDGSHRRDFVFVRDVVNANLLAARADTASQVFNIGAGSTVSVNEVLDTIGQLVGRTVDARYGERRSGDVRSTHADITRAATVLGYRPATDLRTGLAAQIAAQERVYA